LRERRIKGCITSTAAQWLPVPVISSTAPPHIRRALGINQKTVNGIKNLPDNVAVKKIVKTAPTKARLKSEISKTILEIGTHSTSVILQEGDIVTFGHPYGAQLSTGVWKRQPDSEYQFLFERCTCQHFPNTKKMNVLEDKVNVPKLKCDSAEEKESVLNASKILDHCITKISGLAGSLANNSRQRNLSSSNSSLNVSDDQRLVRNRQITDTDTKEEDEHQKCITDFFQSPSQQMSLSRIRTAQTHVDDTIIADSNIRSHQLHLSNDTSAIDLEVSASGDEENLSTQSFTNLNNCKNSASSTQLQEYGKKMSPQRRHEKVQSVHMFVTNDGCIQESNEIEVCEQAHPEKFKMILDHSKTSVKPQENLHDQAQKMKVSRADAPVGEAMDKDIELCREVSGNSTEDQEVIVNADIAGFSKDPTAPIEQIVSESLEKKITKELPCVSADSTPGQTSCGSDQRVLDVPLNADPTSSQVTDAAENRVICIEQICDLTEPKCTTSETMSGASHDTVTAAEKIFEMPKKTNTKPEEMLTANNETVELKKLLDSPDEETSAVQQTTCAKLEMLTTVKQTSDSSMIFTTPFTNQQSEQVGSSAGESMTSDKQVSLETEGTVISKDRTSCFSKEGTGTAEKSPSETGPPTAAQTSCNVVKELVSTNNHMPSVSKNTLQANEEIFYPSQETVPAKQLLLQAYEETSARNGQISCQTGEMLMTEDHMIEQSKEPYETDQIILNLPEQRDKPVDSHVLGVLLEAVNSNVSGATDAGVGHLSEKVSTDASVHSKYIGLSETVNTADNLSMLQESSAQMNFPIKAVYDADDNSIAVSELKSDSFLNLHSEKSHDTSVPSVLQPSKKSVNTFYGSNSKRKLELLQSTLPLGAIPLPEQPSGCPLLKSAPIISQCLESKKYNQREMQVPFFSTDTQRNLSQLMNEVEKQEWETAVKEYKMFVKRWKGHGSHNRMCNQKDFLPETLDLVKSCYSSSDGSALTSSVSSDIDEEQNTVAPQTTEVQLKIFNSETEKYLKRLMYATYCQKMKENALYHKQFIEQFRGKKSSKDHYAQESELTEIIGLVKSNYSLISPTDVPNIKYDKEKEKMQGGIGHYGANDNELEYQKFLEQWHRKMGATSSLQTQAFDCGNIIEVVRANYNIASQKDTQIEQVERCKEDPAKMDQESNNLSGILKSPVKPELENMDTTIDFDPTVTESDKLNTDQILSLNEKDEYLLKSLHSQRSENNDSYHIISSVVNDVNSENEKTFINVGLGDTNPEQKLANTDENTASDSTVAHLNPIVHNPKQSLDQDLTMDGEPVKSQFTTSTPDIEKNTQDHQILVSPVLRVSASDGESDALPEDLTCNGTLENDMSSSETNASIISILLNNIPKLNGTEHVTCNSETKCSDPSKHLLSEMDQSRDINLLAPGKKQTLNANESMLYLQNEETVTVDRGSENKQECDPHSHTENEQTLNDEEIYPEIDCESLCETQHALRHINPVSAKSVCGVKDVVHNHRTKNDSTPEDDKQRPPSPELFSQASTAEVVSCPDMAHVTASGDDDDGGCSRNNVSYTLVKNHKSSEIPDLSAALEKELSKCGLSTTIFRQPFSNELKNSAQEIKFRPVYEDPCKPSDAKQTKINADKSFIEHPKQRKDNSSRSGRLSIEAIIDHGYPEQQVSCRSTDLPLNTRLGERETDLSFPSTASDKLGCSPKLAVPQRSSSPNTSLPLSQISDLKDEDEMHLVWSQAEVSVGQSSNGSGEEENISFTDFENLLPDYDAINGFQCKIDEEHVSTKNCNNKNILEKHINVPQPFDHTLCGSSIGESEHEKFSAESDMVEIVSEEALNPVSSLRIKAQNITDGKVAGTSTETTIFVENLQTTLAPSSNIHAAKNTNEASEKVGNNKHHDGFEWDKSITSTTSSNLVEVEAILDGETSKEDIEEVLDTSVTSSADPEEGENASIFKEYKKECLKRSDPADTLKASTCSTEDDGKTSDKSVDIEEDLRHASVTYIHAETSKHSSISSETNGKESYNLGVVKTYDKMSCERKIIENSNETSIAENILGETPVRNHEKTETYEGKLNENLIRTPEGSSPSENYNKNISEDLHESEDKAHEHLEISTDIGTRTSSDKLKLLQDNGPIYNAVDHASSEDYILIGQSSCKLDISANAFSFNQAKNCDSENKGKEGQNKTVLSIESSKDVHPEKQTHAHSMVLKRKSFEIPAVISLKKKRPESPCSSDILFSTDSPKNYLTISVKDDAKQLEGFANSKVLHPKASPSSCRSDNSFEHLSVSTITSYSPTYHSQKGQTKNNHSSHFHKSEKELPSLSLDLKNKHLASAPLEASTHEDSVFFSDRQTTTRCNEQNLSESDDEPGNKITEMTDKQKIPSAPSSPGMRRQNLKRLSPKAAIFEFPESRPTKILRYISPNICHSSRSWSDSVLEKPTALPVLPTLTSPLAVSHQTPVPPPSAPECSTTPTEEKHSDSEHLLMRREHLQQAVLAELERLTKEIRSSLKVKSPNVQQALEALRDLDQLPITPKLLMKVPAVLETVKKCQRYGGSDEVRQLSHTIFTRFKALILHMQNSGKR
ncbi:hepatoma-derived growth factor-related protein 2, partial [Elysia marginata]